MPLGHSIFPLLYTFVIFLFLKLMFYHLTNVWCDFSCSSLLCSCSSHVSNFLLMFPLYFFLFVFSSLTAVALFLVFLIAFFISQPSYSSVLSNVNWSFPFLLDFHCRGAHGGCGVCDCHPQSSAEHPSLERSSRGFPSLTLFWVLRARVFQVRCVSPTQATIIISQWAKFPSVRVSYVTLSSVRFTVFKRKSAALPCFIVQHKPSITYSCRRIQWQLVWWQPVHPLE